MLGAATEVEALKKALAEAEKKEAKEQATREKHEARVIEVQQELQEAVKKCETLEQSMADKESKLTKARQAAHDARVEAQGSPNSKFSRGVFGSVCSVSDATQFY